MADKISVPNSLLQLAKPKQLTSRTKKNKSTNANANTPKRRHTSNNFDSAPNGQPDENEEVEEESDDIKAFWADFNTWLQVKMDGKKVKA